MVIHHYLLPALSGYYTAEIISTITCLIGCWSLFFVTAGRCGDPVKGHLGSIRSWSILPGNRVRRQLGSPLKLIHVAGAVCITETWHQGDVFLFKVPPKTSRHYTCSLVRFRPHCSNPWLGIPCRADVHTVNSFEPSVHPQVRIVTALSIRSFDSVNEGHAPLQVTLSSFMIIFLLFRSRYV